MSIREQLATAVRLQQKRCEVYHLWESKFRHVIEGSLGVGDFDEIIRTIVVKEFQAISVDLRALHHEVHQALQARDSDCAGAAQWEEQSAYLAKVLLTWIDELQDVERDHYNITIEGYKMVVTHTAPNVPKKAAEDTENKGKEENPKEEEEKLAVEDRLETNDGHGQQQQQQQGGGGCAAEAAAKGILPASSTTRDASSSPQQQQMIAPSPVPHYSVHDAERCALRRIYNSDVLSKFYFVNCRDAFDSLDTIGDEEFALTDGPTESPAHDVAALPEALLPLVQSTDAFVNARTPEERERHILGHYDPSVIACACERWSEAMLKLMSRRRELEQAAGALVEDLQCELSDLLL